MKRRVKSTSVRKSVCFDGEKEVTLFVAVIKKRRIGHRWKERGGSHRKDALIAGEKMI